MGIFLAFFGVLAAACCDLETRKIPNALVVVMWGCAAVLAVAPARFPGGAAVSAAAPTRFLSGAAVSAVAPTRFLSGALLPVICLWPLFKMKAMGAGDIKLMSGIGSLIGPKDAAACFAAAVACAGIISGLLILRDGFGPARKAPLHFAVPVLMGVMLVAGEKL